MIPEIKRFFRWLTCFVDGGSIKLKIMGISSRERKNNPIILRDATIPNCRSISLFTIIKVANPEAVVRFVRKWHFRF
jgi:hypothetical protein